MTIFLYGRRPLLRVAWKSGVGPRACLVILAIEESLGLVWNRSAIFPICQLEA